MAKFISRLAPGRIIALGFALVILLGSGLLMLPCSIQDGVTVRYIDALYTSTSAVCVTGLIAIDAGDTFTPLGQFFLASLIQVGGLGVTAVGAGIILAMRRRVNLKGRNLVREAMNLDSGQGIVRFVHRIFLTTLAFELAGAALSFLSFVQDYEPLDALGISLFHSVAAFNNSGFDILGNFQNLIPYQDDVLLNLVTCALIIFGGIGFLVILDVTKWRFRFRKFTLHTKVVLTTTLVLLVSGTVLLEWTDRLGWLASFFHSVSARTAGFSTVPLGELTNAGLFVLIILMFIGGSPAGTAGGIKTTTAAMLLLTAASVLRGRRDTECFGRKLENGVVRSGITIMLLTFLFWLAGVTALSVFEPGKDFIDLMYEASSAIGTVGLTADLTPQLTTASHVVLMSMMYVGRIGPVTMALVFAGKADKSAQFRELPEKKIMLG